MPPIPHRIRGAGHLNRIGYRNQQDRFPGLTHIGNEREDQTEFKQRVLKEQEELKSRIKKGDLVNFRDVIMQQENYHLRRPDVHSAGWRYVLDTTEDWIKSTEDWPANIQKRKREEEAKQKEQNAKTKGREDKPQTESDWKRQNAPKDNMKHNDAYAIGSADGERRAHDSSSDDKKSEYAKLRERYSAQEIALLRTLQHEKDYIQNLQQNDGLGSLPVANKKQLISIAEADQFFTG